MHPLTLSDLAGAAHEYACRFGSKGLGWQIVEAKLAAGYDEQGRKNEPRLYCTAPASPHGAYAELQA